MIYVAQPGDTAFGVAQRYGVSLSRLIFDNQLPADGTLVPGQALLVLRPSVTGMVLPGDTVSTIAANYGISELALLRRNPYLVAAPLIAGEQLIIEYEERGGASIFSLGYAYPFIRPELLRETLPFLNALYCFSYGFTPSGDLIPFRDEYLRQQANLFGAEAVMVLTPHTEGEAFNNRLINNIINDPSARSRLIGNIINELLAKGYSGLDMDFEYIDAVNRDSYSELIRQLSDALHSEGLTLSVALAPKTYREQPGQLYEGLDYATLGQYADRVLLMTYEWGYKYGPPLAVAPLPNVRQVVEYALTEMPADKIILGIPNYAYDWPLPYQRGTTEARTIGNVEAVDIARRFGAPIRYDEQAQAPFFNYMNMGTEHVVWFEDVRSIQAKLNLVTGYGLQGAGWWSLMRPFRANWMLLDSMFSLRED